MDFNDTNDKEKHSNENSSSISSDLIRGHINTIILRTLYDGDKYGYEIINEIEEKSKGQYALKQPTLYSALKRLESQDYVTSYWGGVSNGGRRKYFQITDKGRKVVEQNLAEWEYSRTVIDSLISEKDYDFSNPPPASSVDFSLLKKSTSRVPIMKGNEADDIELSADAQVEAQPEKEDATAPLSQGWTRETPLEQLAEEATADDTLPKATDDRSDDSPQAPVAAQPAVTPTAEPEKPQPTIITQESSPRWTRESPLENSVAEKADHADSVQAETSTPADAEPPRTLEGTPASDESEDEAFSAVEDARPLTEEEKQRIHANYQSLIGNEDDATSYYYSQVAKNRNVRPSFESNGGSSSRSSGYNMDQYAAQNDLYEEEAMQQYESTPRAPASYDEAYYQNKAISAELLYSDKSPEERNYKDLLSKLYDNTRHDEMAFDEYDGYDGYPEHYSQQPYENEPYENGYYEYPDTAPSYETEQTSDPHDSAAQSNFSDAQDANESLKKKAENAEKDFSENKKTPVKPTPKMKPADTETQPVEKKADAVEQKAEREGLRLSAARETRVNVASEPTSAGKTFDKGKALLMAAIWVFAVALAESIVNICLRSVLESGVWYVVVPFLLAFVMLGAFLFLYLRGYGKNSRKTLSRSYISASFVVFANVLLIICLIAFLIISFANAPDASMGMQILKYAIFPIIYAFNLPLFALLYSYHCNKQ